MKNSNLILILVFTIFTFLFIANANGYEKKILNLPANDIIYDRITQRIYATVPSSGGIRGNSITRIDPLTGIVDTSVFIGSEPGIMAFSEEGRCIYVSLDGAAAVRRFSIDSLKAGIQFALGSDPFFGPYYAEDIEVQPGHPNVIAVSLKYLGSSPRHAGVAIYENGIKRTNQTPGHTGSNVIEFSSDSSRLYGYNNETTEFGFRRMEVNSSGLTILDVTANLFSNFSVNIKYCDGRVYSTSGRVIDPEAKIILGTFSLPGYLYDPVIFVNVPEKNRVFYLTKNYYSDHTIYSYNTQTFIKVDSMIVDSVSGTASSLIRWGLNGLAFRTSSNQVVIFTTPLITDIENEIAVNPASYSLEQNYPNPFNPKTIINYELKITSYTKLVIYDALGKNVATLVSEKQSPGKYQVEFNGSNLTSGVYFYKLIAGEFTDTKKMLIVK